MTTLQPVHVPEREFGPAPWYALLGELTPQRIDTHLRRFLDMEVYEIIPIPLYGLKCAYMGEDYLALYEHMCRRCREWGTKVWIYDEFNWPSGTCGGRVVTTFPDARQRCIEFTWPDRHMKAQPKWEIKVLEGFDLAAYGGEWALESTGYVDTLSEKAVRRFIDLTHEVYKARLGDYFGDVIVGFFTDEPVTTKAGSLTFPYTPGMFRLFHERYGYSLEEQLLCLVRDRPESARVRRDYWKLVTDLFQRSFFRQIAQWCGEHNLKLTGHLLFEEKLAASLHKNADPYAVLSEMQAPAIDMLDGLSSFDTDGRRDVFGGAPGCDVAGKLIESTAFFAGRDRTLCEAFGVTPHASTAQLYKRAGDWLLHHGLSIINDNLFADSNSSFRKFCGCHSFWTPWIRHYRNFSRHLATLSSLNAGSQLVTQVGLYYPGEDAHVRYGTPGTMFGSKAARDASWQAMQDAFYALTHGLICRQWDYYYVFDQVLAAARPADTGLDLEGFNCRVLVLPGTMTVSPEVADAFDALLASGGGIIGVGFIPEVLNADGSVTSRAWGRHDNVVLVDPASGDVVGQVAGELGRFATRSVELSGEGLENVFVTHRKQEQSESLFITNFGDAACRVCPNLDTTWHQVDTIARHTVTRSTGSDLLESNESRLFVRNASAKAAFTESKDSGSVIEFGRDWSLSLPDGNTHSLPIQVYEGFAGTAPPTDSDDGFWHPPCIEFADVELAPEHAYWLRTVIRVDRPPARLALVVDGCDTCRVFVRGQAVPATRGSALWDDDNLTCDLQPLVAQGDNEIMIRYTPARVRRYVSRMVPLTDLPPFVLTGDFAVGAETLPVQLTGLPETLPVGSLHDLGMPHFTGKAEYTQTVRIDQPNPNAVLDLGRQQDTFEVEINGETAGVLMWPPYRLRVGELLRQGENRVTLRVLTAMGRLLRRRYMGEDTYIRPVGLLDKPRLLM